VLWIERQAALLRRRHFEQLDVEHLIEELDVMGGSQRRELRSRLICRAGGSAHWANSACRSRC